MSPETLFLLALFILLPLIERLLQSARQRKAGAPDAEAERPRRAPRPPVGRRAPPPPFMDAGVADTRDVPPMPATALARPSPDLRLAAPSARRIARRRIPAGDLRNPLTLRRAIVLMTVLAPCRAVTPYDLEAASGRGPS